MSLKDKSKKELADLAKELKLKTNSKMDKKALLVLIEEHNKSSNVNKIEEQQEVLETILNPKEERITVQDIKDIEEARSEMRDQPADEKIAQVDLNQNLAANNDAKQIFESMSTSNINKSTTSSKNDDFSYSEGYREKSSSYNVL